MLILLKKTGIKKRIYLMSIMGVPPPVTVGSSPFHFWIFSYSTSMALRERVRRSFAMLRALAEDARLRTGLSLPVLSMGMSGDFESAIAEGSTMVRIGTALFGPRT